MPRKTEILAEETAVSSPLRRSSRKTVVANSPAPATVTTRRNSQSQAEAVETRAPKTRRASLSQENVEKAELADSKPAPRGRKGSTTKEDTEQKTEPAKTRSRRSSAASEPPTEDTEKKQVVTRRRKSIAVEEEPEPESVKPVRSRRGSVTNKITEEDTVKKPIRGRRSSVKEEEIREEPPKKNLRRNSATDEIPEIDTKEKKITRGRRSSTDNDNEPETKTTKLTPTKFKRRPSVTENAVSLEPIEEQDSETIGRKSLSPPNSNLKRAVVNLTALKLNKEAKTNLDLSTIDESSFTEEPLEKSTSEKKVTPRKSPRFNKETAPDSRDSSTPSKSSRLHKEGADKKYSSEQNMFDNENKDELLTSGKSPKQIKETNENVEKSIEQNVDEFVSGDSMNNKTNESLEDSDSSTRKKLNFKPNSTEEINSVDVTESSEIDIKKETESIQEKSLICDVSESHTESIDESVLELECEQEKLSNEQTVVDRNKRDYPDISMGSVGSFRIHLNVSLPSSNLENISQDDNVEDDLNTSKNSNGSDKENNEINPTEDPNVSKANVGEKQKIVDVSAHDINKEVKVQEIVIARVSNVFRPKMIENSFMEPMEVDEYPSILETTQDIKSFDLGETNDKNTPPALSTPIIEKTIQKVEHKEVVDTKNQIEHKLSIEVTENDTIDLHLSVDQIKQDSVELKEESEVNAIKQDNVELKEESEVNATSKEDNSEGQTSKTLPDDTINIGEAIEDTKMSINITVETVESENLDRSPRKLVETEVLIGAEEMEKRQSNKYASNEKLEEETPQLAGIQETGQKIHDIEKSEDTDSEKKEVMPRRSKSPPAGSDELDPKQQLRKSKSPQPEQITTKDKQSEERESLVKALEVESSKDNFSRKSEGHQIQNINSGELESEIEKSPGKLEYLLTKTLVVELESHSAGDELTNEHRKSLSLQSHSQESEIGKEKQSRSLRKSRSPSFERQELKIDQNGKSSSSRKSSPQPQRVNIDESDISEPVIPRKFRDTIESELNQADRENSPTNQDSLQDSSKLEESGKMDISDDYEFDIPSDEEESDKLQENTIKPEVLEKTDKSDISSNESVETHSSPLKRKSYISSTEKVDTVSASPLKKKSIVSDINKSDSIKVTLEFEENIQDLDCRDAVGEVNSTEKITDTTYLKEEDETNMLESNNELISVTEIGNAMENIGQESNLNKDIVDQKEIQEEKDNISIQDEVEDSSIPATENVSSNLTFKKCSPQMDITETKIDEEAEVQDVGDVKEIETDQKKFEKIKESSLKVNITSDVKLSVVAKGVNMKNTDEESSSNYIVIESVTFDGIEEMERDFKDVIQDSSDQKEGKRSKRRSKKRRDSTTTKQHIHTVGNKEELQVDEMPEDIKVEESIKPVRKTSTSEDDYSNNDENNIAKKPDKSRKITKIVDLDKKSSVASNNKDFISSTPKNNDKTMKKSKKSKRVLDEDNIKLDNEENFVETPIVGIDEEFDTNPPKREKEHKKQQKLENDSCLEGMRKSKKLKKVLDEDNMELDNEENFVETPVVGIDEEFVTNPHKREKKHKKHQKSEDESNKKYEEVKEKPQKIVSLDSNQDIRLRTSSLGGLEPFAMSKLDKYLTKKISEMESEDESYDTSTTEEGDREENQFISTMAEEGEEDTVSEGSNDIIDEGESINSTESEIDTEDDYDEDDSFICDEEAAELLSGDEYDLDDTRKENKEKKSRIIKLDDCEDEIIKIKKKEKPVKKKRKSRIITVSDSSDSDLDKNEGSIEIDDNVESSSKSPGVSVTKETSHINEAVDDDVIILEEQSTPVKSPGNLIVSEANLNISTAEARTKKKKSSITIHENINVNEIKDAALSERLSTLVDDFCTTLYSGQVSINISLEHAVNDVTEESSQDDNVFIEDVKKNKKEKRLNLKRCSKDSGDSEAFEGEPSKKAHRLSVTLDNIESSNELNREPSKRKRSKSLESLSVSQSKKKKNKKVFNETKRASEKSLHSKRKTKPKKLGHSEIDELRTQTFSIMNQLITDVKNRPVRTIKPTVTMIDMNGSWITEVADVKPSTTLVKKRELADYKSGKIHPKDFRSKMLYDSSHVRRVDTKTLLRKKGAYF